MSTRVVVIGSGVSGLAAAFAARRAKANVTMVLGRPGASASMSGAIDEVSWERAASHPPSELGAMEIELLRELGIWELGPEPSLVATLSGRLRPARGRDQAVLDLAKLRDAVIALPRANRPEWDADSLARTLSNDSVAERLGLRFEAIDADVLRWADEARLTAFDWASRHDEARAVWLAERLREAPGLSGKSAVLLGPWLGLEPSVASKLSSALGMKAGETLSSPVAGVAGVRFERARDRLLSALDVVTQPGRVVRVRGQGGHCMVELEGDAMLDADKVVLAIGGVAGGGILLSRAAMRGLDDDASAREPIFVASLESPAVMASGGRPLVLPSSAYGPVFESLAWSENRRQPLLESVGLYSASDTRAMRADREPIDWLTVAGDSTADRPRTVLEAIRSGILAGRRAAGGST